MIMPSKIDIGISRQGEMGNCYVHAAVNALAKDDPDAFRHMVMADPDDENTVIVSVHGGTYRLADTLPVGETTGRPAGATSPDGSTAVAYLEKAAAHRGSWADAAGGDPGPISWWLAGGNHRNVNSYGVHEMTDEDVRHVMSSAPMGTVATEIAASPEQAAVVAELELEEGHDYTIAGTTPEGHARLHNPWGDHHPKPLSVQNARKLSVRFGWASDAPHVPPQVPEQQSPGR